MDSMGSQEVTKSLNQNTMTVRIAPQPELRLDADGIHKLLWPHFVGLQREHLWRVDLTARSGFLGAELISWGTIDGTSASPREVFKGALLAGAASIALVHNHPSGVVDPSPQDLEMFERLALCGKIMGIPVSDNLIIYEDRCFSQKRSRLLRRKPPC